MAEFTSTTIQPVLHLGSGLFFLLAFAGEFFDRDA